VNTSTADAVTDAIHRLARCIAALAQDIGRTHLLHPDIYLVRANTPTPMQIHTVYTPALCFIAQGAKHLVIGEQQLDYDEQRMLLFTVDLPVMSQVVRATAAHPYLGIRINLNIEKMSTLAAQVFPHGITTANTTAGAVVGPNSAPIIQTVTRLIESLSRPDESQLIAPLILDELLIRVLQSPIGAQIAAACLAHTQTHRIAQALTWIRQHYDAPLSVRDLAARVHMSPSTLHHHFKQVTAMSPLQYQKAIRLHTARQLLMQQRYDVQQTSIAVGYASVSQFSREYRRFFGHTPSLDTKLRSIDTSDH